MDLEAFLLLALIITLICVEFSLFERRRDAKKARARLAENHSYEAILASWRKEKAPMTRATVDLIRRINADTMTPKMQRYYLWGRLCRSPLWDEIVPIRLTDAELRSVGLR